MRGYSSFQALGFQREEDLISSLYRGKDHKKAWKVGYGRKPSHLPVLFFQGLSNTSVQGVRIADNGSHERIEVRGTHNYDWLNQLG